MRQYSYLFQMAQQLNVALGQLESGGTAAPSGGTAAPAAEREQQCAHGPSLPFSYTAVRLYTRQPPAP